MNIRGAAALLLCAALLLPLGACRRRTEGPEPGASSAAVLSPGTYVPAPDPTGSGLDEPPDNPDSGAPGRDAPDGDGDGALQYPARPERYNVCLGEDDPVVVERFAYQDDVPDTLRLEISLPGVREDLPGAQAVNDAIEADWPAFFHPGDAREALQSGFAYPLHRVDYSVYSFQDVYEICVHYLATSLHGSGIVYATARYCYDSGAGRLLSDGEFLSHVGLTQQAVEKAFQAEVVRGSGEEAEEFPYELYIKSSYYIQEDGQPVFTTGIFS